MASIRVTIVTPEGVAYDGPAERFIARTEAGDVAILSRHIDYAATLGKGAAKLVGENASETRLATIDGGMMYMADEHLRVLTNAFSWEKG